MIVVAYFLVLVVFFTVGLGKITLLMFSQDQLVYLKDMLEIMSWLATIFSLPAAAIAYIGSIREKRFLVAKDALSSIKDSMGVLDSLVDRRWEIMDGFSKFENRLSGLSSSERKDLIDELSAFCKTILKQLKLHHIFPIGVNDYGSFGTCIFNRDEYGNIVDFDSDSDGNQKTLEAIAKIMYKKGLANEIQGKFFLNTSLSAYEVLCRVTSYAQPYSFRYFLEPVGSDGIVRMCLNSLSSSDIDSVFQTFEKTPAAIFYLNLAFGRHDLFEGIKVVIAFEAA